MLIVVIVVVAGFRCMTAGPAPSNLNVFETYVPQGRGTLLPSHDAGSDAWSLGGQTCTYRLRAGEMIPAGTRLVVQVTVSQPDRPLQRVDVLNSWTLSLRSKGWFRKVLQSVDPVGFVGSEETGDALGALAGNVALLGKLTHDSVQPTTFEKGASATLNVFFRPEQPSGYGGMVTVEAPLGFNFATEAGSRCQVSRLPEIYYRVGGGRQDCPKKTSLVKALLKRSCFLTKPLILGIGASKVLPRTRSTCQSSSPA